MLNVHETLDIQRPSDDIRRAAAAAQRWLAEGDDSSEVEPTVSYMVAISSLAVLRLRVLSTPEDEWLLPAALVQRSWEDSHLERDQQYPTERDRDVAQGLLIAENLLGLCLRDGPQALEVDMDDLAALED